ncbi:MAG TPA: hypothetical protein VFQ61_03790 [Polyangiaceae bacterium]|nr:hypothetical protein [Polyangiaceae bacterium]
MKTPLDDQLRAEIARFRLVFTCETCAHFEPDSQRCASEYPNAAHRLRVLEDRELEFCKEYELS